LSTPRFVRRNAAFFVGATERRNANDLRKRTDDRSEIAPKNGVERRKRSTVDVERQNDGDRSLVDESVYFSEFLYFKGAEKSFSKIFRFHAKKRRFARSPACEERKKMENE